MEIRRLIFGSTLFITGTICSTLLLSNEYFDNLILYFVLLILMSATGLVLMLFNVIDKERIKAIFQSDYDITGKHK